MDLIKHEGGSSLPIKLEDLAQFVLIGREQLTAVRAGIRALDKLDVAEGVRKQKREEAQMLAEALLDAEVRIGEILAAMPSGTGKNNQHVQKVKNLSGEDFHKESKLKAAEELGFNRQQVERFQTLAANKDLVEAIKQEAREADDLPTRTAVLKAAKERERVESYQNRKAAFEADNAPEIKCKPVAIIGDSVEVLQSRDLPKINLFLSDPPYGMDFKSGRPIVEKWDKIENDKIEDTVKTLDNVFSAATKHLAEDAHVYIFGHPNEVENIKPLFEKYFVLKNILIWDREVIGLGDLKTYGRSYDVIYFGYYKIWRDLNGIRERDVLRFSRISPGNLSHPTEKPLDVLEYLIKKSTSPGDWVLDPFAGSFSTCQAAYNLGRNSVGIELKEKYLPEWMK